MLGPCAGGAAYSPAVYNYSSRFDPDYGYIYVRIVIDAQNREKVQEAVNKRKAQEEKIEKARMEKIISSRGV